MDELETYLKDLHKERARIKLERSLQITKDQIKSFIAELVKGDVDDKAFQKKIIDNLVYRVYIGDGDFFVAVNFFDIHQAETVTLTEIQETLAKCLAVVLGVQTLTAMLHHHLSY